MTQPAPTQTHKDPNAEYYLRVLHELIDMGNEIARHVRRQIIEAKPGDPPPPSPETYETVSRGVRRTMLLARKMAEPLAAAPTREQSRKAARKDVIRRVEHAIDAQATGPHAETLRAELLDRIDSPEFEDDLATYSIDHIIEIIRRDLGIAVFQQEFQYKRRTPEQVLALCLQAAAPAKAAKPRQTKPPPAKTLTLVQDG